MIITTFGLSGPLGRVSQGVVTLAFTPINCECEYTCLSLSPLPTVAV